MSNGIVDVVVAPEIGRIMAFSLAGRPETSPIWRNPGKPRLGSFGWDAWMNYGGDKLWPSPQYDWEKRTGGVLPDKAFDHGPYRVTRIKDGIRLIGPESESYGISVVRDIMLESGKASVILKDCFVKSARSNKQPFPVAIWGVTQVRPDVTVFSPFTPLKGLGKHGYSTFDTGENPNCQVRNDLIVVKRLPGKPTKVGAVNREGWIAALYQGNLLFTEQFAVGSDGPYLDGGTNAQFYTSNKPEFIEMELHSCGRRLAPHTIMSRTIVWTLERLDAKPKHDVESDIIRTTVSRRRIEYADILR